MVAEPPVSHGHLPNCAKCCFRPLIPLVLALMVGIAAGVLWPGGGLWSAVGIMPCAAAILWHRRFPQTGSAAALLFFSLLGYLSIQPYLCPHFKPHHVIHYTGPALQTITGQVVEVPVVQNNRQKLILRAEGIKRTHEPVAVSGNIRMTVMGLEPALQTGDRIEFDGRLATLSNFNNPGGFNYRRHMAFSRIWVSTYAKADRLRIFAREPQKGLASVLTASRTAIQALIDEKTAGRPETQAVLKALIVGQTRGITDDLRQAFNRCGVGHLLAISGLHVGIVAACALLLFDRALSLIRPLLWLAWTRRGAAVLAVFPVVFYGLLSGMSPSTQRAVIMVTAYLAASLMGRQNDLINTVALAALGILIIDPPALFSISFQLSFASVLAIVWGSSFLATPRPAADRPWWRKLAAAIWKMILISLFATLGTLPLVTYYFNQVSFVGPWANLILIPLLGSGSVALGLFAVFCYPLSISLSGFCLSISGLIVDLGVKIIHRLSDRSLAAVTTVTPTIFEIILFYLGLVIIFNLKRRPIFRVLAMLLVGAVFSDLSYWIYQRFLSDELRVTAMDVGQGSAALLELPRGFTILVDGGGFADNESFDVGKNTVAPLLWRKKIRCVDLLVLTHPNSDHLNGLLYIADHFHVKTLWSNGQAVDTAGYRQLLNIVEKRKIHHPPYPTLARKHRINGVSLKILHPPADFLKRDSGPALAVNDNSLVLKLDYANRGFLFTGDLEASAEKALCRTHPSTGLRCDVLFAPHHGSRSSSTQPFVDKVQPRIVVISANAKAYYGFPHPQVIERYRQKGAAIYRTDQAGAVRLTTDGMNLRVRPFLAPDHP
jgi:competence protein ComEC